jgi:hypothetical protein
MRTNWYVDDAGFNTYRIELWRGTGGAKAVSYIARRNLLVWKESYEKMVRRGKYKCIKQYREQMTKERFMRQLKRYAEKNR